MSLVQTLDAAFSAALDQGAKPFRLHPLDDQIEVLRAQQILEPLVGTALAAGAYRDVNILPVQREPVLFAQPSDRFPALHLPIEPAAERP